MEENEETPDGDPTAQTAGETAIEVVSAAVSTIPFAGGALAAIAEGIVRRRQSQRLAKFLLDLSGDFRHLSDRVNEEFIRSGAAKDLFEDIVTKAAETRQQTKLDAFRAIFENTAIADHPNYNEAAEIAALVDDLQERHVILLRILADPVRADRETGGHVGEGGGIATSIRQIMKTLLPTWDDDQIERTWKDLFDRQIHRTPGTVTMMTDTGIHQLENRLSPFGLKVVRYITLPH